MALIAGIACLLAVPRLIRSPDGPVFAYLLAFLAALVPLNALAEMVFGVPCPACSRWTLRRLARHPRYYRCSVCRARFKRSGFGPWLDASGPDDAGRYRQASEARPWEGFAVPEDLDGTTSGLLLQNKRSRERPAEDPRPPRSPGPGGRFEEARRKVRRFLGRRPSK
jgi:hypothetical protein